MPYILITISVFLAWLPLLGCYIPVMDDYNTSSILLPGGLGDYFHIHGMWRIIGHTIAASAIQVHPLFYNTLAVFTHLIVICLFFAVCKRLIGNITTATILSLLMASFPWGYQAIVWASAYPYVLATGIFLANVLVLTRVSGKRSDQAVAFIASYLLTVLALLIQESLTFAFMVSGLIVWLTNDRRNLTRLIRGVADRFSGWGPALGVLSYIGLYEMFKTAQMTKPLPDFNAISILSTYYFQWSNIYVFQPLFEPATRQLTFDSWTWIRILAGILLSGLLIVTIFMMLVNKEVEETETNRFLKHRQVLGYIVLLLLGASFVYAVGGGYSLDSRKKYQLVPLMLLLMGWCWSRFGPVRIGRKGVGVLTGVMAFGIITTWLMVGIWKYEVARTDALAEFLSDMGISGKIHVMWNPDLYRLWPAMESTWGFRLDDQNYLNNALNKKGGGRVTVTDDPDAITVRYEMEERQWRIMDWKR